jgi:hypothetical protein
MGCERSSSDPHIDLIPISVDQSEEVLLAKVRRIGSSDASFAARNRDDES